MERMHVPRREMIQVLGIRGRGSRKRRRRYSSGDREMSDYDRQFAAGGNGRSPVVRATRIQLNRSLVAAPKWSGRLPVTRRHFPI